MSSEITVFADQENRLFRPMNLVSNRRMNASNQKREKIDAGKDGSNGESAKLTRAYDWRTTDQDEIKLRQQRARDELDERGRPKEYRNLELLHERIRPLLLRRRKADVETELPGRLDRNFFVSLNPQQRSSYQDHEVEVAKLLHISKRRPLTKRQQEQLMRELAMMRMICDTIYILDHEDRSSPKIEELERILEERYD